MSTIARRDESVRIPPAVRANAARAEALIKGEAPPPPQAQPEPQSEPQALTAQQAQVPQDGQPALTATPVAPPAPEAPPEAPQPRQRTNEEWEHAFNSVNERYRSQVRVNNDLQNQIAQLTQQVSQLQNARSPDLQPSRLITPEEEHEWGGEMLTVVGKKAKEEVLPEIEKLRGEIDALKGQVTTTARTAELSAREQMFAQLDAQLPQWRVLNNNPKFIAWLDLPDGLSDAIRQTLLDEAVGRNDAAKVLRIFNGFLAEEAALAPRPQPTPAPKQADPLAKFAAPGRARTAAATNAPAEKPHLHRRSDRTVLRGCPSGQIHRTRHQRIRPQKSRSRCRENVRRIARQYGGGELQV